jgi:hypothetical protein
MIIKGVELVLTCSACPEQYDAFIDGQRVAYLRLRHGYFYASCPWVEGVTVYEANTKGDGIFDSEEREKELNAAVDAILEWVRVEKFKADKLDSTY